MRYPIGIQDFEDIIRRGCIYVDKTALVYDLVTQGKIYFLSRPRRFGKSLLVSTLKHYYLGHKELFKGLAIDSLETEWLEYPVFHLSFAKGDYTQSITTTSVIDSFLSVNEEKYGVEEKFGTLGERFTNVLKAAHEKTGRRAVVLIDEYDKPLLDVMCLDEYTTDSNGNRLSLEEYNRRILKGFYGTFKDADEDLQFVLLTGVTKFSQISVFSGFNQPDDISMSKKYEALCGITKEELLTVFDGPIHELAKDMKLTYEETVTALTKKYDGYHFGNRMIDIFNPFSIINCFNAMEMNDYWFASGTPTYLVRLLAQNDENINEIVGKYYDTSEFINYKADQQRPLPMIYQSGYLTIKDCDARRGRYLLDFPNEEVRKGFIDVLASDYFAKHRERTSTWLFDVTDALEAGNAEQFMKLMTSLTASVTYRFQRKQDAFECERYFQYTFFLILQMIAHFNTVVEKETSEGRIDCVVETPDYVYIMEFKLNGSAEEAMQQIEERGYAKPYAADPRKVISIGINFSSETGTVDGYIIR